MSLKLALSLSLVSAVLSAPAAAAVIDFSAYADGTAITTIGDATFSLAGVGEAGTAKVYANGGVSYLWNSSDGIAYPTNDILRVAFTGAVSNLKFDFNPFGFNGEADQGWFAYDSSDALIGSGAFSSSGLASYDLSAISGIARIDFNNGSNDWLQGLSFMSYDAGSVPVPATPALVLSAVAALALVRRSATR